MFHIRAFLPPPTFFIRIFMDFPFLSPENNAARRLCLASLTQMSRLTHLSNFFFKMEETESGSEIWTFLSENRRLSFSSWQSCRFDVITSVDTVIRPMTLQLKVRRVGNSVGVVLPKEALARLNVN